MAHPPTESQRGPGTLQPPERVLELLELLGVAMCEAGESTDRITTILDEVASSFGTHGVRYFVLPTGVFVRVEVGETTRVDFTPAGNVPLRLDQVDALYRLIDDLRHGRTDLEAAHARLDALRSAQRRFGPLGTILGTPVLILGLGRAGDGRVGFDDTPHGRWVVSRHERLLREGQQQAFVPDRELRHRRRSGHSFREATRPISTRSKGWTQPSLTGTPPASRIASRSGAAHRCSMRTSRRRSLRRWSPRRSTSRRRR